MNDATMRFHTCVLLLALVGIGAGINVLLLKPYDVTAAHMYDSSDSNHDGIFTLEEFAAEFKVYDINHDGAVTRHEYTAYVCFLSPTLYQISHYMYDEYDIAPADHHLKQADYSAFYHKLDADHDGTVQRSEWISWWSQKFASLETANAHTHGQADSIHGNHHCH
ncbi:uncharacterized protein LOC127833306 isoform X1 [Dreissena polymorpha]|nr:uncharacterized protein LOC127833306 isoform X1 [Dreissena polymorpha]